MEPERTIRINITARESQVAEIDSRARAAKLSRSAYMVQNALKDREAKRVAHGSVGFGKIRQRKKTA